MNLAPVRMAVEEEIEFPGRLQLLPLPADMAMQPGQALTADVESSVPVVQRAATDVGITILGKPDWSLSSMMPSFDWLPSFDLLLLDLGLLFSLFIGWRIASTFRLNFKQTLRLNAPWSALAFVLYALGVWIIFQPMQMRGMMMHSMH